ncbi:gem-associated protein 8-like [Athalia rosae]|uniref:gem-associated protein 8-like n=1 Tax=Athalia rosae TaxID=37344 RepID=UPI002033E845|nr:gem-associated protein 8-like [Athalia rosae]
MDVNIVKRGKTRKRKRHSKVKRREQARLEVRFAKRRRLVPERSISDGTVSKPKEKLNNIMEAHSFWENYEAAHLWQRRHSVEWWKSRCIALEQENAILRDKIRELASTGGSRGPGNLWMKQNENSEYRNASFDKEDNDYKDEERNSDDENLEFQVNEEMMKFFEQSIRHKMEMKEKRDTETANERAALQEQIPIEGGAAWMEAKTEAAKLLYGVASPRILAMETALQATMDRYKDRAKPQYWPNIPLNL